MGFTFVHLILFIADVERHTESGRPCWCCSMSASAPPEWMGRLDEHYFSSRTQHNASSTRHAPLANLDRTIYADYLKVLPLALAQDPRRISGRLIRSADRTTEDDEKQKKKRQTFFPLIQWNSIFAWRKVCAWVGGGWVGVSVRAYVWRSQSLCRSTSEFNRTANGLYLICYLNLKSNR